MYRNQSIKVLVFCKHDDREKYLNLFKALMGGNEVVTKEILSRNLARLVTPDFDILFMRPTQNARGHRAHFVLNLIQDEEFDSLIAKPLEVSSYLAHSERWLLLTARHYYRELSEAERFIRDICDADRNRVNDFLLKNVTVEKVSRVYKTAIQSIKSTKPIRSRFL